MNPELQGILIGVAVMMAWSATIAVGVLLTYLVIRLNEEKERGGEFWWKDDRGFLLLTGMDAPESLPVTEAPARDHTEGRKVRLIARRHPRRLTAVRATRRRSASI